MQSIRTIPRISVREDPARKLSILLAPLITGAKPMTLLRLSRENGMKEYFETHGERLLETLGLSAKLFRADARGNVYLFYDEKNLARTLEDEKSRCILTECGYTGFSVEDHICRLIARSGDSISHESGIFFGIPAEDVRGFCQHKKCLLRGYFSVYSDVERAEKIFRQYGASKKLMTLPGVEPSTFKHLFCKETNFANTYSM